MTLKYESELLFDLMKRDGDDTPSDVLPYESELKEKYLEQVEGAYPKLQDYRPEWLYYNLYYHIPSDFPVESVANVTSASFNNVVPYAYKSAILKGCTLVNLLSDEVGEPITVKDYNILSVKENTKYIIFIDLTSPDSPTNTIGFLNEDGSAWRGAVNNVTSGISKHIIETQSGVSNKIRFHTNTTSVVGTINRLMIIEYQEGMENWDIPYFTGMQSVQIPVLTTTGKNLFNIEKLEGLNVNIEMVPNGIRIKNSQLDITRCFTTPFKENTQYTVSFKHTQIEGEGREGFRFHYTDGTDSYIIPASNSSWVGSTLPNKTIKSVSLSFNYTGTSELTYIQLEEGTVATSYEPHKSNILTVNEDVTLRSNGDVYDELNLLTGRLTQRIDENNEVLAQAVVKTVDLSCINEQGKSATFRPIEGTMHVNTSSQALPPLLDMSVPVEATTQNLMSFANIEEEE